MDALAHFQAEKKWFDRGSTQKFEGFDELLESAWLHSKATLKLFSGEVLRYFLIHH